MTVVSKDSTFSLRPDSVSVEFRIRNDGRCLNSHEVL